jgi:transposase
MNHLAIDLGSRESQICVRNSQGVILEEERRPTTGLGKYLSGKDKCRVVVESCAEAFVVADAARKAGHEVAVVPTSLVRALGVGSRGIKNDVRDAQNLSKVSCRMEDLPSVHVPSEVSRERKSMSAMREALVEVRTKLVNTARSWLRTQGVGVLAGGTLPTFPGRYRRHVEKRGKSLPSHVERVLQTIEDLNPKIAEADKELEATAEQDPTCKLLMTAPGVGPVTAVRFAAAIDEVERFEDAHGVESYLGLIPGESSSGDAKKKHMKGITKAGPPRVRWALTQAAWTALRCCKHDPMVEWARQIEARRGKKVAVIALVRKLAGVLFAMWRDGKPYDPRHESKRKAVETATGKAQVGAGVTATTTSS